MITEKKCAFKRLSLVLETQWMFNQCLLLMVLALGVLTLAPTFTRAGYEAMSHLFVIFKLPVPLTPLLPIHKEILLSPLGSDLLWHYQNTQSVIHFLDTAPWVSSLPETFTDCGRHRHKGCSGSPLLNPVFSSQAPNYPSRPFPPWREFLLSLRVEIPPSGNSLIPVFSISTLSATCTHHHFLTLCLKMKT